MLKKGQMIKPKEYDLIVKDSKLNREKYIKVLEKAFEISRIKLYQRIKAKKEELKEMPTEMIK